MVASEHDGSGYLALAYSLVERQCNLRAALCVGVEDASLRTHHELVSASLHNPVDVVSHLSLYLVGRVLHNLLKHTCRNLVSLGKVGRVARCAYPAERTESVVEEHRSHDVLHVRRIAELAVGFADVGTGALRLQEECVAVVEEVHAVGGEAVDGSHLAAQRRLHMLAELVGVLSHHRLRLLEREVGRIVAACPRVVERGLVAAYIHVYALVGETFPQVDHVAHVSHRHRALLLHAALYGRYEFVEIVVQLVHPALVVAFLRSQRVYLSHHAHHAGYVASLRLRARHAAQTRRHEQHTAYVLRSALLAALLARRVQHGDGSAVHDALRTDVHVRSGSHLSVLAHTESVHALPVVGLRVVGYHHSVRHHHARSVRMRREESERMTRVHHERLLVGHLAEVFHCESVLRPVLEDGTVASVHDEFVRMLRHLRVQVVLNHEHDGGSLFGVVRILVDGASVHIVCRTIAVHIDASVGVELSDELRRQLRVQLFREVAQSVAQCQLFLLVVEYLLALRRMIYIRVVGHRFGKEVGYAQAYLF